MWQRDREQVVVWVDAFDQELAILACSMAFGMFFGPLSRDTGCMTLLDVVQAKAQLLSWIQGHLNARVNSRPLPPLISLEDVTFQTAQGHDILTNVTLEFDNQWCEEVMPVRLSLQNLRSKSSQPAHCDVVVPLGSGAFVEL